MLRSSIYRFTCQMATTLGAGPRPNWELHLGLRVNGRDPSAWVTFHCVLAGSWVIRGAAGIQAHSLAWDASIAIDSLVYHGTTLVTESYNICHFELCLFRIISSSSFMFSTYQNLLPFESWILSRGVDKPILPICSSVSGHWGCFHILATVKDAAMNVDGQMAFQRP